MRRQVDIPTLEYEGTWWLPEAPEKAISGKLTYYYGQNPTLSLNGMLGENEEEPLFPIILGDCKGNKITLVRCFSNGTSTKIVSGMGSYQKTDFEVGYLCEGWHFSKREDVKFTRLSVKYSHLRDWLGGRVFHIAKKEENEQEYILKVPKSISNEFGDSHCKLTLRGVVLRHHDFYTDSFQKTALFIIEPSETKNFESIFHIVYHMKNFLGFCIDQEISIISIKGTASGAKPWEEVNILSANTFGEKLQEKHLHSIFGSPIKYNAIENNMATLFSNWLKITNELEPVYQLFFATKEQKLYPVTEFLGLSQAIEAYHSRRFENEIVNNEAFCENIKGIEQIINRFPQANRTEFRDKAKYWNRKSLRKRTKELCAQLHDLTKIFLEDERTFISKFVNTRNYYTHYEFVSKNDNDIKELLILTEKVRFIIIAIILKELGLEKDLSNIAMQIYVSHGINNIYS